MHHPTLSGENQVSAQLCLHRTDRQNACLVRGPWGLTPTCISCPLAAFSLPLIHRLFILFGSGFGAELTGLAHGPDRLQESLPSWWTVQQPHGGLIYSRGSLLGSIRGPEDFVGQLEINVPPLYPFWTVLYQLFSPSPALYLWAYAPEPTESEPSTAAAESNK